MGDAWLQGIVERGNVAAVVKSEEAFQGVLENLEFIGFEVACSDSLEETFKVVSADPEEWDLVIIRLDQPFDIERIVSFVRTMRMMDRRVPILIFSRSEFSKSKTSYIKSISDCTVFEPTNAEDLYCSIIWAVQSDTHWGALYG